MITNAASQTANATPPNNQPFPGSKRFRRQSDDPRIEVLHVSSISKAMARYSFRASMIDHLEDIGGDTSAIVLRSGVTISLSLPYSDLAEAIDEGASPIDLKTFCESTAPVHEPQVGERMPDGSIFAGLTADGKQQIYAMPTDLSVTLTFNDAAKVVKSLNDRKSLGHDDWLFPTLEHVHVLYKHRDAGALKGTFSTTDEVNGSDCPGWYWSSTKHRVPPHVWVVRLLDGFEVWHHRDLIRLSCRPVRLVAVEGP